MVGRKQKVSRANSTRFSSEYLHPSKRKCVSLDSFGIPTQVISLSKMSQSEKKELQAKLKAELEQVQSLQKKLNLLPSETLSGQGKNGYGYGSTKQIFLPSSSNAKLMTQCGTILRSLMKHQFGWVFNKPVDVVELNIPDYLDVIKNPMDFGTIKSKITKREYSSPLEFLADVRLTFSNALTYNPPSNDVYIMADKLSKQFESKWKNIEKKLPVNESLPVPVELDLHREALTAESFPPYKKRKTIATNDEVMIEPVKRIMTKEEKENLSKDIESSAEELPQNIVDFLKKHSLGANHTGEDDIEIDIDFDVFSNDTLFTLRELLDEFLREKLARKTKSGPCEVEILNVSGPSNSSSPPCKETDHVDEDVDICGDDPPISSYPPVEIEKDTTQKTSECSSSSSSSGSDSESSSSDSDSDESSATDADKAEVSSPVDATKEMLGSVETLHQQTSDVVDLPDRNQMVSGLDQVEQSSQPRLPSVEVNSEQGHSTPLERQLSPEKIYRAALLRSRFADTILKAREKTLNQDKKGDPEELERQRREEKARLQAEARAAEDACKQAEAVAAAEAKRRRELEREASRQALSEIEKTVQINENTHFLEDLELLKGAPAVLQLPSVNETSQEQYQETMDCFNFQGSNNPLEQLGLFIKNDEDEEEVATDDVLEPSPPRTPIQQNFEKGDID